MNEEIKDLKTINKEFSEFLEEIKKNKNYNYLNLKKAFDFAKKAHMFQERNNSEPYIGHPVEVMKIAYKLGMDEPSLIAALLHDVVEDTDYSLKDIEKEFSTEVSKIVNGLTKINLLDNSKREERRIETLKKILLASAKDIRILIIKICDRLHNMRTLGYVTNEEKKIRIAKETLLIYVPIAQKIGLYSLKWELEDLSFKYLHPEMYQFIKKKLNMKREEREKIVQKAVDEIKEFLNKKYKKKEIIVLGRPKNFYSIYKKIKEKAKDFDEIYDLYAVRIITKNVAQCYTILGLLHENFQSFPNRLKDYIANPKANGYQSIHTVIYSRKINYPVEIQIRTEEMHKLAEFGVAAHWKYKNLKEDKKFEKKISWLREVLQWEKEHKDNKEFLKLLKFDFFEDEIFVFTPKSDIITLPEGSTVLDFAYAIHTDIGNKATKGKINGAVVTLDKELKNGDIVEIITNQKTKPHERSLSFVKTSKARARIRDATNIKHSGKSGENENKKIPFELLKSKIENISKYKKVKKAGCCEFKYGDQIVGILGKKKELVIHNAKCDNAKYSIKPKIRLVWQKENNKQVTINMQLDEKYGNLIDVLNVFSEFNLKITKLNTKLNKDASVNLSIKTADGNYINKLVSKLNKIDSVKNIKLSHNLFDW